MKSGSNAAPISDTQHESLASLGMFAAAMAHEIRNPLTAIKARLFTLQKAVPSDSAAHEDAAFIENEIDRLERIVREFLQYARPAEPSLVPVAPAELLGEVVTFFRPQLGGTGIELELRETATSLVLADPHQIKQVLINLVQNAIESIVDTGRIDLSARDSGRTDGQRTVILEVADTGSGIPEEFHAPLFDLFFTDKPSGTGLGLPIAQRVISAHGGTLSFHSEVNRGTTFAIELPAAETK